MALKGLDDIYGDIEDDFKVNLAVTESLEFRIDNDDRPNPTERVWCKLSLRESTFKKISYNEERYNSTGFFTVQLFQTLGKGSKAINMIAKNIRNYYNDSQFNDYIFFEDCEVVTVGRTSNNPSYFQINVICKYRAQIVDL